METRHAPAIFMITNAKQTNANEAATSLRLQLIENIPARDLTLLAWATQFRRIRMGEDRKDNLRASMTREVKKIARDEHAIRRENVNLYSFRHAFVDRVRREFFPHEAAALSGHTSQYSLYAYGENRVRKGTRKSGDRRSWLPKPDPVQAEVIRQIWQDPGVVRRHEAPATPDI